MNNNSKIKRELSHNIPRELSHNIPRKPSLQPAHGGELALIKQQFPKFNGEWLDLSTGISPWSYPLKQIASTENLRKLPDKNLFQNACNATAKYYQIPTTNIIASAGAQAIINILPAIATHSNSNKPTFYTAEKTYNEYARVAKLASCTVKTLSQNDLNNPPTFPQSTTQSSIVILGNPNNPDGKYISQQQASNLSKAIGKNGWLVIDEAFCDVSPQHSLVKLTQKYNNLIILKSFGKFFGLAGIRLGFAITNPSSITMLADYLGPWHVSSIALITAQNAYQNNSWIENQRSKISAQANKLQDSIQQFCNKSKNSNIITNSKLFITLSSHNDLFSHCAHNGIYIRSFQTYKNIYRIGLPKNQTQLNRIKQTLNEIC